MIVWRNDAFLESANALDARDRGLTLGDGLFETIYCRRGIPAFLDRHLDRLRASADVLKIPFDPPADIRPIIKGLAARNDVTHAPCALRLTLTRGPGGRGLVLPGASQTRPTLLMTMIPFRASEGTTSLAISEYRRSECSVSAHHKTLSYLDQILARDDAIARGASDAVLRNSVGNIACASAANLFLISAEGEIVTPQLSDGALPGIVRALLFEHAPTIGVSIVERQISPGMLRDAPIFLANSLTGPVPALLMGERDRVSDNSLFKVVQSWYARALDDELEKYDSP